MPWLFSSLLVFGAGPARADTPRWEPALLMGHPEESGAIHALALGDVLCDGWPELLVGEAGYNPDDGDTNDGRVEVHAGVDWVAELLDPDTAESSGSTWERVGGVGSHMGLSIDTGDANGDGCADFTISEPLALDGRGGASLYLSDPDISGIPDNTQPAWGVVDKDQYGIAVRLSDVDADGLDDWIIGADGAGDDVGVDPGAIYVHHSPTFSQLEPDSVMLGEPGWALGFSILSMDVDQDGFLDLVTGAPGDPSGGVLIHPGGPDGITFVHEVAIPSGAHNALFGKYLADLGDTDGDGSPELAVCAPEADGMRGWAYVYSLAEGAPELVWELRGPEEDAVLCQGIGGPGDLNGDGYMDLMVSQRSGERTLLFYGGPDGLADEPAAVVHGGTEVLALGDIDGDGFDDVAVGAYQTPTVRIYLGRADLDKDGVGAGEDCDDGDRDIGALRTVYADVDGDGFGDAATAVVDCALLGDRVETAGDCDDTDPDVHPGAEEVVADGVDQDCDATEICYVDADGDGVLVDQPAQTAVEDLTCTTAGLALATAARGDCDDTRADVYPGALDWPDDGVDQDCQGGDSRRGTAEGEWSRTGCAAPVPAPVLPVALLAALAPLLRRRRA